MDPRPAISLLVCCALLAATTSCTYHRAHIDYADYAEKIPLSADGFEGERLGTVAANEAGAIWNDCTKSAKGTLWILMDESKRLGGNAIGEIRWIPNKEKQTTELPTCRKGWAWFLVCPVLLTPVFMSSRAEAQAFRIPQGATPAVGRYRIPESDEDRSELIERILAANQPESRPWEEAEGW